MSKNTFNNPGMGECIILKDSLKEAKLVCAINCNPPQYVIAHHINFQDGTWLHGEYLGNDIDKSLSSYNKYVQREKSKDNER